VSDLDTVTTLDRTGQTDSGSIAQGEPFYNQSPKNHIILVLVNFHHSLTGSIVRSAKRRLFKLLRGRF